MMNSTSCILFSVIFALAASVVLGYDEAGCQVRSNETYTSGINTICKLPFGAHTEDHDWKYSPLHMNRCQSTSSYNVLNTVYGVLAALVACAVFGSMFLPVKKFDTGDGMFFQWMMATGALLVGLIVNISVWKQPPFLSFTLTGGILWGTGNILTVPTLKLVGIGMGQTMVGVANAIGGWISGRFILCQPLKHPIMNIVGVVIVLISAVLLSFVGSDGRKRKINNKQVNVVESTMKESVSGVDADFIDSKTEERTPLIGEERVIEEVNADMFWVDKLGKWRSRAIGLTMAIITGLLFGFQFLPVELLRNCDHDAFSCNELHYVFAQYVGIFMCSTFWFLVYCCFKRFKPQVYSKLVIPGMITGVMYGIGTVMWFLSNKYVGLAVAFPIITSGSGIVASAWGIIVFREIKGKFNILMFIVSLIVVVTGILLVGLSH